MKEEAFNKTWEKLQKHYTEIKDIHMRNMFKEDNKRADKYTIENCNIRLDYSMNRINDKTLSLLLELAENSGLKQALEDMFTGKKINETEKREVLHIALRNRSNTPIYVDNKNVMENINKVLDKMTIISDKLRTRKWFGYTGKSIKNIINIGIGGSDLGPVMVCNALKYYSTRDLNIKFISNIDEAHFFETTQNLNPEETLFIVASKTFTTLETMTNAHTAKTWVLNKLKDEKAISKHFIALSTNSTAVRKFGIDIKSNMLEFWDWVGGRYSMCSAIGLSIMIAIGKENFINMLEGFHSMDNHFRNTPFKNNMPVILSLLGIWYNNFFGTETHAILPYSEYLNRFPAYLQQADMESNGKSVNKIGENISYQTGPIIWGEPGTNGQHAFFQLIHQGTKLIPSDFIGFSESLTEIGDHQNKLMANLFAQTEALAMGRTSKEVTNDENNSKLINFKVFAGNKPTNKILMDKLTPFNLGTLIALYEHKIFVQGIIWDIFSFDQWGVELGKICAKTILEELNDTSKKLNHDSSTNNAVEWYRKN